MTYNHLQEGFAMRQVQFHEAEEQFASLIAEAEAGESLTILRAGKPVAQIVPFPKSQQKLLSGPEREAALQELIALMKAGVPLGGAPPTRDDMHDGR